MKKTLMMMIFTALIYGISMPHQVNADIPLAEREALIDLYQSTGGENWLNNTGWLGASGTECNWYGVWCDVTNTHVEELYLRNNELRGSIPASVENLSHLLVLYMDNNYLESIPPELGRLSQLQYLYLNNSQLIGRVPEEITNLIQLVNNGSDFRYNSLCTADNAVRSFLNLKQRDQDWESSQTPDIRLAVIVLQIMAKLEPEGTELVCDMNRDDNIGMADAIYILQQIAEIR